MPRILKNIILAIVLVIPLDVLDSQMKSFENVKHDEGHNSLNIVDEFEHNYLKNHGWLIE